MNRLFLSSFLLVPFFVQAQWTPSVDNIVPSNYRVWSIKVAPDRSIWAYAENDGPQGNTIPVVIRSVDEGQTWTSSTVDPVATIGGWDVSPIDSQYAFVAGHRSGLYRTTDGGQTWDSLPSFPYTAVYVHFFSDSEGVAFGSNVAGGATFGVSCTADSGNTWTHIGYGLPLPTGTSLPTTNSFFSFSYSVNSSYDVVEDTMIVGRRDGTVWKSEDRGYNWIQISTPLNGSGIRTNNVAMKDGLTFMVAGDINFSGDDVSGVTYTTQDGGLTWVSGSPGMTVAATDYLPGSEGTFLMSGHNDFGFGGVGTVVSHDFGETWDLVDDVSIIAMDFLDDSTGYGTCCNNIWPTANGQIHKWNGDSLWISCTLYNDPITVSGDLLFVSVTEGKIQWLDCDDDYAPIPGANTFSYSPDSAGNYAVELRVGRCIDTVDCVSFQGTTSLREEVSSFFRMYPNPTKNDLHLSFSAHITGELEIEIFDLQGRPQMVKVFRQPGEQVTLSLSHLTSGYYQVQLTTNDQTQRLKLLKQ